MIHSRLLCDLRRHKTTATLTTKNKIEAVMQHNKLQPWLTFIW